MIEIIKILVKLLILAGILLAIKLPSLYFDKSDSEYLQEGFVSKDFDTVLIGSSRTKFAVIPAYFDKLTGEKTKSFNFGIVASSGNESLATAAQLINSNPKIKHVIVELSIFNEDRVNFMEDPWQDLSVRRYLLRVRMMSFSELMDFHDQLFVRLLKPSMRARRADYNVGIEKALKNYELAKAVRVSAKALEQLRSYNLGAENGESPLDRENDWNRVNELIKLAESKNVKIRFLITPRLSSVEEMKTVSFLYGKLDEKHKLQSDHSDNFYYTQDVSIDSIHLNNLGAMRFTENIASEFNRR